MKSYVLKLDEFGDKTAVLKYQRNPLRRTDLSTHPKFIA